MPVPVLNTLLQLGSTSAATGGGAVGSGSAIGSGGIFNQFSSFLSDKKGGIDKARASVAGNLNKATNINIGPAAFASPQIDPSLVASINKSNFDFTQLADSIIDQSGLKDLMTEFKSAKTTKTKETTSTEETAGDKTPTQKSDKPVEAAKQSREEGRTNLEQLFLDLINGKLDIKL